MSGGATASRPPTSCRTCPLATRGRTHGLASRSSARQQRPGRAGSGHRLRPPRRALGTAALELNYCCPNEIPGLENPTSELISSWLWARSAPAAELSWITVYGTGSSGANFNGRDHRIWKEMTPDSAGAPAPGPQRAPPGCSARPHSCRCACTWPRRSTPCRAGPWILAMKTRFDPLFQRLDHHPLYEIGLPDPRRRLHRQLGCAMAWRRCCPEIDQVDLYETRLRRQAIACSRAGPTKN